MKKDVKNSLITSFEILILISIIKIDFKIVNFSLFNNIKQSRNTLVYNLIIINCPC